MTQNSRNMTAALVVGGVVLAGATFLFMQGKSKTTTSTNLAAQAVQTAQAAKAPSAGAQFATAAAQGMGAAVSNLLSMIRF